MRNLALSENSGDIAYYSTKEKYENRLNKRQGPLEGQELNEFIEFLEERVSEIKAGRPIDTIETNADADPTVFYAALDPNKVLFLGSPKDIEGFKKFMSEGIKQEVQPEIILGPDGTGFDTKFSEELSNKIETVLREKYPEITVNFTNDPIGFDSDPDVFNQERKISQQTTQKVIAELSAPLKKACFSILCI